MRVDQFGEWYKDYKEIKWMNSKNQYYECFTVTKDYAYENA